MKFFKKKKCKHIYLETDLYDYDLIFGERTIFVCVKCHKEIYMHASNISGIYEKQRLDDKLGIERDCRYVKEWELDIK